MPRAAVAHVEDLGRESLQDRPYLGERGGVAANHDRQRAGICGFRPSGDAGVEKVHVSLRQRRVDSLGRFGRGRRQVDDHLAGARVLEHPAVAEHHRLDDARVRQRQQHDVDRGHELRQRAGGIDAARRQPLGVTIVGDDRIARLADSGGHPPAHLADADDPGTQRAHPSASIAWASAGSASANDSTPIPLASSNTSISSAAVAP